MLFEGYLWLSEQGDGEVLCYQIIILENNNYVHLKLHTKTLQRAPIHLHDFHYTSYVNSVTHFTNTGWTRKYPGEYHVQGNCQTFGNVAFTYLQILNFSGFSS
jgi:hypothetical protein